jgi:hypothetical protein
LLSELEADWAFDGVWIYRAAMLREDDSALGDEAAGGGAGGLHEGLPLVERGHVFATGQCSGYALCGFGGTDGFAWATLGEEREDGGFEFCSHTAGLIFLQRGKYKNVTILITNKTHPKKMR